MTVNVAARTPTAAGKKRYATTHPVPVVARVQAVVPDWARSVLPVQVSDTNRKSPGAAPDRPTATGPRAAAVLQLSRVKATVVAEASFTTTVPKSAADALMVSGPVATPVRFRLAKPPLPPLAATVAVLAFWAVPCGLN